ncbi:MAG: zf-HC2 domain-containing protein, partial [Planctomycetota bacterium]
MNTHEQINEMLAGYVLGELSDRQSSEVEAHLAECQDCGGEVERLKALIESTAQMSELSADEETCESARRALFETIVTEEIKEPMPRQTVSLESLWRTIMKSGIAKLAAAAVIILGVYLGLHSIGGPDMANVALGEVTSRADQV